MDEHVESINTESIKRSNPKLTKERSYSDVLEARSSQLPSSEFRRASSYHGRAGKSFLETHKVTPTHVYVHFQEIHNVCSESLQNLPKPNETTQERGKMIRNKSDLLILIACCLVEFNGFLAFSMIAPFYPIEARKKHVSATVSGLVFSVHPLVVFLLSPFVGKWIPHRGAKILILVGCFCVGCGQFCFAFVPAIHNQALFVGICFVVRIIIAVGTSFANTAALAYLAKKFNVHLSAVFGITELFVGLGFMAGPSIGGVLYGAGGFRLPFIIVGVINLSNLGFIWWVVPKHDRKNVKPGNDGVINTEESAVDQGRKITILKSLKIPAVCLIALTIQTIGMFLTFIQPTFTYHLKDITHNSITVEKIGLVFFLCPGVYAILAPILGMLLDKKLNGRNLIIVGHFLVALSYMFLGPSPLFDSFLHKSLTITSVAYAFVGVAQCPIMVPVIADLQDSMVKAGYPSDFRTSGIVSGIFTSAINLGQCIGPAIGGLLHDYISFSWSTTCCAIFVFVEGGALLIFTLWERSNRNPCCSRSGNMDIEWMSNGQVNVSYNHNEEQTVFNQNGATYRDTQH